MTGVITFCDILGYQSFLANNSASESALKVLDIITNTPKKVKTRFEKLWFYAMKELDSLEVKEEHELQEIPKKLKHLVFSDTIVLMLPYPENVSDHWRLSAISYIIHFSAHLKARMFKNGLPLRCVIHEGEFITKEACLAGKAVVEAYQLTESLDLSALVFSPTLGESIAEFQKTNRLFTPENYREYFINYLTPIKNNTDLRLIHCNWISYMNKAMEAECKRDVNTFVLKAFWSHQKDCPASVDGKVNATSKLIRRLLIAQKEKG